MYFKYILLYIMSFSESSPFQRFFQHPPSPNQQVIKEKNNYCKISMFILSLIGIGGTYTLYRKLKKQKDDKKNDVRNLLS
jgi:hypothetical protein